MIKNYIKTAWQNLWKHRTESAINIIGLCVAFTSALLLLLSVAYEFSYDRFHANAGSIYHVFFRTQRLKGAESNSTMPAPLLPALKSAYPDLQYGIRNLDNGSTIRYKDKKIAENLKFTDPDFFTMFSFPILEGNSKAPLAGLNDVVLRASTAHAIFGDEEPVGKMIELRWQDGWKPFTVSAIAADYPANSSFTYDAIVRFENSPFYQKNEADWDNRFHDVFIQLKTGISQNAFEAKLPSFVNKNLSQEIRNLQRDGVRPASDGSLVRLVLQPLLALHTDTTLNGMGDSINESYLYLLAVIGFLILMIACINFINLSIGKSFSRSREIGLRKTMGALRHDIALQFWGEALLVCTIAFVLSLFASYFLLPSYKLLFAMHIQRAMLGSPAVWCFIAISFLLITLIAGGYPAWLMGKMVVVEVLKGKMSVSRSNRLRNGLIVFQFVIAVLLISCTLISWEQIHYLRTKPLGFNVNQVISIPVNGDTNPTRALKLMRDKLSSSPYVESISGIYDNLGKGADNSGRTSVMGFDYKNREIKSNWMGISYDFVKTLDLQLIDGRDFSTVYATDSNNVLVNEAMAREIGEEHTIGTKLPVDSAKPLTVIGVLKDFNFKSLRQEIAPLTLVLDNHFGINYILIKVKKDHLDASMSSIRDIWKIVAPGADFQGSFLDENVNRQYKRETQLMEIFTIGAIIAIALSCMGLLAMVILIVSRRTREIGIRKVLGASIPSLVSMFSLDFIVLVMIATIIATPLAWYTMHRWLESFAYRIEIGWTIFLYAGLMAAMVAMITVGMQSMRAAMANPVKNLRSE
jgi:putative ABC transport system permease protein